MNFKKLVSTNNYMVCEIKNIKDIPELCEEMDKEGFQLISSLSIPSWNLESADKMTSLGSVVELIFRKIELNFTASNEEVSYNPSKPEQVKAYYEFWYDDKLIHRCKLGPIDVVKRSEGTCSGRTSDGRCIYRPNRVPCHERIFNRKS